MREQVVAIFDQVRAIADRVAIELATQDDQLRLFVIVEAPGEYHGRYSYQGLDAWWPRDDYDTAAEVGRGVAASAKLPFECVEPRTRTSPSAWIRRQPDRMAVYGFNWRARWFDVGAFAHHAVGVLEVEARAGNEARTLARQRIVEQRSPRPLTVWIDEDRTEIDVSWPYNRISEHNVRVFATRANYDAAAIARSVIAVAPDTTPLQLRIVFGQAFKLRDEALDQVGAWKRGELDDIAFTAAMPAIATDRLSWDLRVRVEDAFRTKSSVAAVIGEELARRHNMIESIRTLREAFELTLPQAMEFADDARGGDPDAVDAKYRQILRLR